jgi:hypothetical protein
MTTLVRLRVALPDKPGALGRLASVIADLGGNITAVDVHRSGVLSAIDDLTVEFPEEPDMGRLSDVLQRNGAATLLSHQVTQPVDPVVAVLRHAGEMLSSRSTDPEADLVAAVADICSSPVVWVSSMEDAERFDAGRFARERGGAIALRSNELPEELADRLPGEVWLLAVPDPELIAGGRVVFVARPLSNQFTSTEITRIEALMSLYDRVSRFVSRPV